MAHRVFVDGQEGTTGLQIHDLLSARGDIELLRIDPALRKDAAERARLLNSADVAFLCLPDAAAKEAVALVSNPNTVVIDASTAHRTDPGWVYGLPELHTGQRELIRKSRRIANPGCHATAFILLLRPLVDAGLVPPWHPVSAHSLTGYSGGGKKMIEQYQAAGTTPGPLSSPRPYALTLSHKHVPEMMAHTGLAVAPLFAPIVANFYKGLAVTVPLHLAQLSKGANAAAIQRLFESRYGTERFVRVHPLNDAAVLEGGFFDVQGSNDTNRVDIFVFASPHQILLMAREDNLGKGASGAAVQCMNLVLGLDEGVGLRD